MKKLIFAGLTLAALAIVFALPAQAQDPGVYYFKNTYSVSLNGATGTNCAVKAGTTNTCLGIDVSEYDDIGLQVSVKSTGAATSTVQLNGYKSSGIGVYETVPSLNQLVTLNGATAVVTFIPQSVIGAGNFKLAIGNTNLDLALTNTVALRRVKANTVNAR